MGFFDLFRKKKEAVPAVVTDGYVNRQSTAEVVKHNTLMNGVTSSRGQAMGFVMESVLVLKAGAFTLTKEMKTTKRSPLLKDPVSVRYEFTGSYTQSGSTVELSAAKAGKGTVSWGTLSKFLDTGDGEYNSEDSPGILSLYPTAFFVENCKNVPMTVRLNEEDKTFTIDAFDPVILSPEQAGQIRRNEQELDPSAGLMAKPLVADMSRYSLKERYAKEGLRIGTCINPLYLKEPYEKVILEQFSSVTVEKHLKPDAILSQEQSKKTGKLTVVFGSDTVEILDWCKAHDMPFRGHTLIWYLATPEWVFHVDFSDDAPNVDREELLRRMEDFTAGFFAALRQGGWDELMYCLDVVNEAVIAPDKMRKCHWQEIIGDDYPLFAYRLARKYAPAHIKLAYNDFDLEIKTDKVIELVNRIVDENGKKLVDIVGQQGHYGAYSSIETLGPALEKIWSETGCEVQVTELDVSVSRQGTEDEFKTQGRFYYNFAQTVLDLKAKGVNLTGLTMWGFTDALSWMPSGFLMIYDRNMTAKYAYFGLLGLKELAGFDQTDKQPKSQGWTDASFEVAGEGDRYILLRRDGSFIDTTTGSELKGRYQFDGVDTYMLIPQAGGYSNLKVSGESAERTEAAGNRITLKRVQQNR